jgi:hypothetical protein
VPGSFKLPAAATNVNAPPVVAPAGTLMPQPQSPSIQPPQSPPAGQQFVRPPTFGWQTAPVAPQPQMGVGVGTRQLARPQLVTPQFMSLQPAPIAPAAPTVVTQPAAAAPATPGVPAAPAQPAVR